MSNLPTGDFPNDPRYRNDKYTKIEYFNELECVEVDGVDSKDYPDFCDAFFSYAEHNGRPLEDDELIELTIKYPDILNEMAYESII